MAQAIIGLGSNLGDRRQTLERAIAMLAATTGVERVNCGRWVNSKAIGGPADQPDFSNGAALVITSLPPEALLSKLQEIETSLGRDRRGRWFPRTIDLDLLLYDDVVKTAPGLELPHPRMAWRHFVLEPAADMAADWVHPTIGWTLSKLLDHLNSATPYVAISGSDAEAVRCLAAAVAAEIGWRLIESPAGHCIHAAIETAIAQSGALDSTSLTPVQAIEFLRGQAALVARNGWTHNSSGAISSFWIEDVLAIGDVLFPGALEADWQQFAKGIVPPKLLVQYMAAEEQREPISEHSVHAAPAVRRHLNAARRSRADRRGIGPVLRLSTEDPVAAKVELLAAIQSMS